jgi:hypothetical protein
MIIDNTVCIENIYLILHTHSKFKWTFDKKSEKILVIHLKTILIVYQQYNSTTHRKISIDTDLLSTLILITEPLGRITFRSIAPDNMSGGVSSVTGICKDIVCLEKQNIPNTHEYYYYYCWIKFHVCWGDTYMIHISV